MLDSSHTGDPGSLIRSITGPSTGHLSVLVSGSTITRRLTQLVSESVTYAYGIEQGTGTASFSAVLAVLGALGVADQFVAATDPLKSPVGRALIERLND